VSYGCRQAGTHDRLPLADHLLGSSPVIPLRATTRSPQPNRGTHLDKTNKLVAALCGVLAVGGVAFALLTFTPAQPDLGPAPAAWYEPVGPQTGDIRHVDLTWGK